MEPQHNSPNQANAVDNPLHVMSPGEEVIASIKRHPIGLIGVYVLSGIMLLLLFGAVGLLPQLVTNLSDTDRTLAFITAIALGSLIAIFTWIAIIIYNGNRWIVTSDSITQIQQTGLFRKQTSQLSLENLEDVTFEQTTLLQSMFNYGTLKAETAGEHSKFHFDYCPNPKKYAVDIIEAHEEFMNENQRLSRTSGVNMSSPTSS